MRNLDVCTRDGTVANNVCSSYLQFSYVNQLSDDMFILLVQLVSVKQFLASGLLRAAHQKAKPNRYCASLLKLLVLPKLCSCRTCKQK